MNNKNQYLKHFGVKGQKWGIRRFQNPDGSLTDEGRRHYGYGQGRGLISQNTKDRIKQGWKAGLKFGGAVGVLAGAAAAGGAVMALSPFVAAGTVAAYAGKAFVVYAGTSTLVNGVRGAGVGAVVGAVETHAGRKYINDFYNRKERNDFERREARPKLKDL